MYDSNGILLSELLEYLENVDAVQAFHKSTYSEM